MDSGGAGQFRGGLGYEKHIRMLKDAHFMSIADRSILACWGVRGGKAGMPFQVVIDPGGPDEREVDALADAEEIKAGQVVRIRTTGGGGWGDPLARDPESVVRDVVWRKVSAEAALRDYGVVLTGSADDGTLGFDAAATVCRARGPGRLEPGRRRVLRPRSGLRLAGRRRGLRRGRPGLTWCASRSSAGTARPAARSARRWPTAASTPVPLGRADWPDLAAAVAGCEAAYVIAPNLHPDEPAYVASALAALASAGVERVVYHSVASPYAPAMPHHVGKAVSEDLVRRSGLGWTILQPGAYLQNLDLTGPLDLPYSPDVRFGFLDLADLGRAAAVVLTEPGHGGATYELATRVATVARAGRRGGCRRCVGSTTRARTPGCSAMFAYYDDHGLPVGHRGSPALVG